MCRAVFRSGGGAVFELAINQEPPRCGRPGWQSWLWRTLFQVTGLVIVQFQYDRDLPRNYMKRLAIRALSCLPFLLCAWVASANQGPRATFTVGPAQPMLDDRLSILVSGLPPNRLITIKARSRAQDQLWWRSEAVFNSGAQGTIDLRTQAPVSGSYRGADGMGLFWSMKPDAATKSGDHAFFAITDWFQPIVTEIEADDAGQTLGSAVIERRVAKPGVHCTAIAQDGIDGLLCDPGDGRRHPGVIVLGGSEGGAGMPDVTVLLASHGFTAMSLAYFGAKGLPPTLQNIPVENFGKALKWMRARPETDPHFVAVFGVSRGAEAALQFAATYSDVSAVVARSPSYVRWGRGHGQATPRWSNLDLGRQAADLRSHSHSSVVCRAIRVGFHDGRSDPADSSVPARFGSLRRYRQCRDSGREHSRAGAVAFWKGRSDMAVLVDGDAANAKAQPAQTSVRRPNGVIRRSRSLDSL